MALLWRDQLSVGNDLIDADHKYLIEVINSVETCLARKDRTALREALDKLSRYSLVHFEREEKIARAVGYTQLPTLNESHVSLMAKLDAVKVEIESAGQDWLPEQIERFTAFLRNWLIDHVIKEDLLMKPTLQKHSPAFFPG